VKETRPCDCGGGDSGAPEHELTQKHFEWSVRIKQTEEEFQGHIVYMARYLGWVWYHTHDSRRSPAGFPDLVLVRDRVLFREVKAEKGRLSPAQVEWHDRLQRAGADVGVWRPSDWDRIERELTGG